MDLVLNGGFPRGSLILVAGNPGAGKTALSVQFLVSGAGRKEPGVYASLAENRETLLTNFSTHLGVDLRQLEKERQLKVLDLPTMKETGVSEALEEIVRTIGDLKAKRLVIDSFTSMSQALEKPIDARAIIHTALNKIVRMMDCTTMLIAEVPTGLERIGLGLEEFVADGVIFLRRRGMDSRLLRELEIVKMRGIPIKIPRLVFTLSGGFKAFAPQKPELIQQPKRFQALPDPPGRFSTGIPDLDEALGGGYPIGSTVLIEIGEKLSTLEYQLLTIPTRMNFMVQGRLTMVVPMSGEAHFVAMRNRHYGATEDEVNRLLRVAQVRSLEPRELAAYEVIFNGKEIETDYAKFLKAEREVVQRTGKPYIMITSLDSLTSIYGMDRTEWALTMATTRTQRQGSLMIVVARPGVESLVRRVAAMANVHLRLVREYGVVLLNGVKPMMNLHAVQEDTSKGYAVPRLTPVI